MNERAAPTVASSSPVPEKESTIVKPRGGGEFSKRSHSAPNGKMPYRLYVPVEYDKAARYPLVIWLHGAGGSGDDNEAQIAGDQIPGTQFWTTAAMQKSHPSFVLVPQTNVGWELDDRPNVAPSLALVLQIMDAIAAEYPIDPRRIYLLGQSMGGGGVWTMVTEHPQRFAAVVLLCPVITTPEKAPKAARVPTWIFIGDRDGLLTPAKNTRDHLIKAGNSPRYTEYKGEGHDIWTRVFKERELASWLFAQSR